MSSTSFNSSSSSSSPVQTPQNGILDQVAQYAQGLASQMLGWAQQTFAQTSQITNQAVGNFFTVSQNMLGLSGNLTNQYNNLFAPENAQLVADANSYNSAARQAVNMGQAGATAAQAGDQALKSAEAGLQSYGINPADGRYAALDKAAAVQNAANVAGAQNTQRNADIATGQNLRTQAVQVGAQLPAAIANVNNTAIQANTGASNAILANANTGKNLMSLPNDYLGTAMQLKLPPMGQQSSSMGSSNSSPSSGGGGGGSGGGAGAGGGGGTKTSSPAWGMNNPAYGPISQTGGGIFSPQQLGAPQDYSFNNPTTGVTANDFTGGSGSMDIGQAGTNAPIDYTANASNTFQNPFDNSGFGQTYNPTGTPDNTFGNMSGGTNTPFGNISYDPSANQSQVPSDWSNPTPAPVDTNWGSGADQYSQTPVDTSGYSAPVDTSGGSSDPFAGYADGGAIPAGASPSGGQQTDDVPAVGPGQQPMRMNANEFVIPQDVALWKGQEFFQNLINQSRKGRLGAPAKPKQMPMR